MVNTFFGGEVDPVAAEEHAKFEEAASTHLANLQAQAMQKNE